MDRRSFLKWGAFAALAGELPHSLQAEVKRDVKYKPLDIRDIEINAGLAEPFFALHVSDSHLVLADSRDNERKTALAAGRLKHFPFAEHYLDELMHYAAVHEMPLLHTGDMIDFVSESNLDHAAAAFKGADWTVCAGNHEYSQYVGEALEDAAYRQASYDRVQEAFPNDLTVFSRDIGGVRFVCFDNGYYRVTAAQVAQIKDCFTDGHPVVLLCHVPFYTPRHYAYAMEKTKGVCAYLCAVPDALTATFDTKAVYPEDQWWRRRSVQQKADAVTLGFADWLKEQPQLKGILCGHCHYFYAERFSPTAMQYTVGAGYNGCANRVHFV